MHRFILFYSFIFFSVASNYAQSLISLVGKDYQAVANDGVVSAIHSHSGAYFFVAGNIENPPLSPGGTTGNTHSFISKFDTSGTEIWTTIDVNQYNSYFVINSMAIDANDNIYITGYYKGYLSFGGQTLPYIATSGYGLFAGKVNASGQAVWLAGGSTSSGNGWSGLSIDVDINGNAYVLGSFSNTVTIAGSSFTAPPLNRKNLLVKFDASGTALWAQEYGLFTNSSGGGFNKLAAGEGVVPSIYLGGSLQGSLTLGNFTLNGNPGNLDLMLMKLDNTGSIINATAMGGTGNEFLSDMHLKGSNLFFAGEFTGSFTVNGTSYTAPGGLFYDNYILKTDTTFSPGWVQAFGGANSDFVYSVKADDVGNVYMTGDMRSNILIGSATLVYTGLTSASNSYLIKLDPSGQFTWAENTIAIPPIGSGSVSYERGKAVSVSPSGDNIFVMGEFAGTMQAGPATISSTTVNRRDMFMMHYAQQPVVLPLSILSLQGSCVNERIRLMWEETAETSPKEYMIESSEDGSDFSILGSVTNSGVAEPIHHYEYNNVSADYRGGFYRLRYADATGRWKYSNTICVRCSEKGETTTVAPNPASIHQPIWVRSALSIKSIAIYEVSGKLVSAFRHPAMSFDIRLVIDEPGTYVLKISAQDGSELCKTIVVR